MPTTFSNCSRKRRRVSCAYVSSPDSVPSTSAISAVTPRLRTVSIMPGMLSGAPDRTTSNGRREPPKARSTSVSI